MGAKRKFKFEWRRDDGQLVATTFAGGNTSADALRSARAQMFAKGYNPFHLVFRCIDLGPNSQGSDSRQKKLTRKKDQRKISTEFDAQGDFWWNKEK
jgi:hypothetical protein